MDTIENARASRKKRNIIMGLALTGTLALGGAFAATTGAFANSLFPEGTPVTSAEDRNKLPNPNQGLRPASKLVGGTGEVETETVPFADQVIGLKANVNGKYVTAENAGKSALIANRAAFGPWEKFMVIKNEDGSYSLKAMVNGKYLTTDSGNSTQHTPLLATRSAIGAWEKFEIIKNSDESYSFKSRQEGLYIVAENAGNGPLFANRAKIGPWEKFTVIPE